MKGREKEGIWAQSYSDSGRASDRSRNSDSQSPILK